MASKQYEQLRRAGFSAQYLKTPAGSHPAIRSAIPHHQDAWRTCAECKGLYCDLNGIDGAIANAHGNDLRKWRNASHGAGFCSWKCAGTHYGVTELEARQIIRTVTLASKPDFYESRPWRELRYEVLAKNGGRCECCGRTSRDGVVLHVDHIKPRHFHPHLALTASNLQILCADCNIGKGAWDATDWRSAG